MLACHIPDLKDFMSKIFMQDTFDAFEAVEISIVTYNTFLIDGAMKKEFYSKEEFEEMGCPAYSMWKALRPFCFSLIKGKRTPQNLKFVFRVPNNRIQEIFMQEKLHFDASNVSAMFVNIRYENGQAILTTGISMNTFTLDKTAEHILDDGIRTFLKEKEISILEE